MLVPLWEARANVASSPDAYPQLARTILKTGTLGFGSIGATPTTTRGPGFPLWLCLGIVLGGDDVRWLAFWGGLPGVIVGVLVFGLLLRDYGEAAAVCGGLVVLLHPLPLFVAGRALGDDFTGAVGMMGLMAFFARVDSPRWRVMSTLAAGGALALHLLSRSTGLLTLVGLSLAVVCASRRLWRRLAVVLVIALIPAIIWSIRSSRLEHRPVVIQSLVAYNFWLGEGFDRFGTNELRGVSRRLSMELIFDEAGLDKSRLDRFWWIQLTPGECASIERRLSHEAWKRITDDPSGYLGRVARGLLRFWFGGESALPSRVYVFTAMPVILLALLGAARWISGRISADPLAWAALATILLNMLAYAATIPMARYSVAVYPEMAYLAGMGGGSLVRWIRRSSSPRP